MKEKTRNEGWPSGTKRYKAIKPSHVSLFWLVLKIGILKNKRILRRQTNTTSFTHFSTSIPLKFSIKIKSLGLFVEIHSLAAMAALPFCGQSSSALHPKYSSSFTPRSHFCKLFTFGIRTSSISTRVRRRRRRRNLCVKNVASDKKQELQEPLNEEEGLISS